MEELPNPFVGVEKEGFKLFVGGGRVEELPKLVVGGEKEETKLFVGGGRVEELPKLVVGVEKEGFKLFVGEGFIEAVLGTQLHLEPSGHPQSGLRPIIPFILAFALLTVLLIQSILY